MTPRDMLTYRFDVGLLCGVARSSLLVACCVAASDTTLVGQHTRAEEIAQAEAERASRLTPPRLSRAEQAIVELQSYFLEQPSGFFPSFDSVYPGGGFTFGGGYRQFYGDHSLWNVKGLYSMKQYKLVEVATVSPGHLEGRLTVEARAGWRDATQVAFYGLGMESSLDNETSFGFEERYVDGAATLRPVNWFLLNGRLAYEDYTLEPGDGSQPSIETAFTGATAPGLGDNPSFLHSAATAAIDWRTSAGYSRRGGYYGLTLHDYTDPDGIYSFNQLDGDLIQHLPILRETWVISLRARVETTLDDNDLVPHVLLPALGGGNTLRAFPTWRFRDRHSLLMSGEWRWIPSRLAFDMAIFYDAGKVASRRAHLNFEGMSTDWGIGARFHGPAATPLRIELARGSEGWRFVFAGSPAF